MAYSIWGKATGISQDREKLFRDKSCYVKSTQVMITYLGC